MDKNIIIYPIQLVSSIYRGDTIVHFKSPILLCPFRNIKKNSVYINYHLLNIRISADTLEEVIRLFEDIYVELYLKYKDDRTILSKDEEVLKFRVLELVDKEHISLKLHPFITVSIDTENNINKIIEVDVEMASTIIKLNSMGFYTEYSCQGDDEYDGYVSFKNNIDKADINDIYNIIAEAFPNTFILIEYSFPTYGSHVNVRIFRNKKQYMRRWEYYNKNK